MTNREIAQEISNRIGNSPIPFDSVYSIALQIYNELGGDETQFDSVYSILLEILPLVEGGIASKVIDDSTISTEKTWSSSKINEEIQAVGGTADSEFDGKTTEDFRFVTELPLEATEGEQVVIKGENVDTLYKYVSGTWVEQTPDANILYFDTENEALYSYVSAEQQFATISSVSTIVVGKNLNTSEALKAIKTPGTYSVLQRTSSTTKGEYTKKWTLTVEGIDYEEYELTDSIYQRMQSNYTIYKRTWSSTRATNDGWSNFSTYYAGEIKDSTTSKYYTWSSNKLNASLGAKQDVLTAGQNISIDASNNISAEGYIFDASKGSFAEQYFDDDNNVIATNIATGIGSHAEGCGNTASGNYGSHAEGYGNTASGECSHAEGFNNTASGNYGSHAEGYGNTASSDCAHAEGGNNVASSYYAHAEGQNNTASGNSSHAEGAQNTASGTTAHAEGWNTIAQNQTEHAEGQTNLSHKASDTYGNAGNTQHSVGIGVHPNRKNAFEVMQNGDAYMFGLGGYQGTDTKIQNASIKTLQEVVNSKQDTLTAGDNISIDASNRISANVPQLEAGTNIDITDNTISAKGYTYDDTIGSIKQHNVAYGDNPSTEDNNIATGTNCAVFGQGNTASSKCTFVAGESNSASSSYAVAVGYSNTVSKAAAVAFGRENTVAGQGGFAEGYKNNLTGQYAHAEGRENTASGLGSHVEGYNNSATAQASHAEGQSTSATSTGAHAEGETTQATGIAAHAEGFGSPTYGANIASGNGSHVEGIVTIAQNFGEHAEGCSNISHKSSDTYGDLGNTQHSVGIGDNVAKKNALEIMQNGDAYLYGVGGYQGRDTKVQDATIKTLQEYIASLEARIAALEGNITVE